MLNSKLPPSIRVLHIVPKLGEEGLEQQLTDILAHGNHDQVEHIVCYLPPTDTFIEKLKGTTLKVICLDIQEKRAWFKSAVGIARMAREEQPDIIHAWCFDAILATRLARLFFGVETELVTSTRASDTRNRSFLRLLDKTTARISRRFGSEVEGATQDWNAFYSSMLQTSERSIGSTPSLAHP